MLKRLIPLCIVTCALALVAAGTVSAGALSCGGAPTLLTAPNMTPAPTATVGSSIVLTRGNWNTNGCGATYTYTYYAQAQPGSLIYTVKTGTFTGTSTSWVSTSPYRGMYIWGKVVACENGGVAYSQSTYYYPYPYSTLLF